ncbi:hypothetical protein SAMN04487962_1259 [Marinobacter segnicrescens]|uniref:Uncharacterized protein n=1 Tax=Marinobacter segnicrescens TaxID=430453 RepID=A0A1I0H7E0_9GAMM|nr:hypothetical protein [Marinobacter segnicrescens]SET79613.1 hypothetical protein SAMN04487962_1259 [Marinobacter segnicrescens]
MKNYTDEELRAMSSEQLDQLLEEVDSEIEMLQREIEGHSLH